MADGRVILLTGAAGGLGAVMTAALLADGHAVAALDRDAAALKRLCAGHDEKRLFPIDAELADVAACAAAVDKTVAHFGRIEALINNAGIGMSSIRPDAESRHPQIEELTADMWDRFFAINLRAPMLLTKAAVRICARRDGAASSTTRQATAPCTACCLMARSRLRSNRCRRFCALQLEGSGITVNVLVPGGPTDTPFISDGAGWPRDKMLRPQIMGPPIRWLMSDASNGVNGRRFTAGEWDAALPPAEAARAASRDIGWPELAAKPSWW